MKYSNRLCNQMRIIVGIGSNDAAAENKIAAAVDEMRGLGFNLTITRNVSSRDIRGGETTYFNALAMFDAEIERELLEAVLKTIEDKLGRDRENPVEVAVDLDLLAYGTDISPELMDRSYNRLLVADLLARG